MRGSLAQTPPPLPLSLSPPSPPPLPRPSLPDCPFPIPTPPLDPSASWVCTLSSHSRPVWGYWPILGAMQTSAASAMQTSAASISAASRLLAGGRGEEAWEGGGGGESALAQLPLRRAPIRGSGTKPPSRPHRPFPCSAFRPWQRGGGLLRAAPHHRREPGRPALAPGGRREGATRRGASNKPAQGDGGDEGEQGAGTASRAPATSLQ